MLLKTFQKEQKPPITVFCAEFSLLCLTKHLEINKTKP